MTEIVSYHSWQACLHTRSTHASPNSHLAQTRQKQSDKAVFTLTADKPRVEGWSVDDRTYAFVNRSSKGFVTKVLKGSSGGEGDLLDYEYYAGTVPRPLFRDLEGYSKLMVESSDDEQLQGRSESILWIGTAGVIAQTHHDRSYNFFTQLVGKKTFHLFPPSAWEEMKLFPATHPSRRQSQLSFGSDEAAQHAELMRMRKAVKAELGPGYVTDLLFATRKGIKGNSQRRCSDVLYVPPLWFHAVESVGSDDGNAGAMSLSVLSPSLLEKRFSEVMFVSPAYPLPKAMQLSTER